MAKRSKFILLTLVFAWSTVGPAWGVEVGEAAPFFTLSSLDGQKISLSDFRGQRPVLLYFWATWCSKCKREWPKLLEIASDTGHRKLIVLGINVGVNDSARKAKVYREKYDLTFPLAFDKGSRVTHSYGVIAVPTTLIIDSNGVVRYRGVSLPDDLETYLETSSP